MDSHEKLEPYLRLLSPENMEETVLPMFCNAKGIDSFKQTWSSCINFTQTLLNGEKAIRGWYNLPAQFVFLGQVVYENLTDCPIENNYDEFVCFTQAMAATGPQFQKVVYYVYDLLQASYRVFTDISKDFRNCLISRTDLFKAARRECSVNYFSLLNLARVVYTHS